MLDTARDLLSSLPTPPPERFGKYTLLGRIAVGGMGELFLARLVAAGGFEKLVVIKRLLSHFADDTELVAMFAREARTAAQLSHPNICQVYDFGQEDGRTFMALEYLEGVPLLDVMAAGATDRRMAEPRLLVPLLAQIAEGLYHAHGLADARGKKLGLVHRDVNPSNIVCTSAGTAKLIDFGIAKLVNRANQTKAGAVKGTYAYMSPEQLERRPLDGRSDVFSLGVIAWEALVGCRLFKRASDVLTWRAITDEPIQPVARLRPDLPGALAEAVDRALARDRDRRPATARELGAQLIAAIGPLGGPMLGPQIAAEVERVFRDELAVQRARARVGAGAAPVDREAARDLWSSSSDVATFVEGRPRLGKGSAQVSSVAEGTDTERTAFAPDGVPRAVDGGGGQAAGPPPPTRVARPRAAGGYGRRAVATPRPVAPPGPVRLHRAARPRVAVAAAVGPAAAAAARPGRAVSAPADTGVTIQPAAAPAAARRPSVVLALALGLLVVLALGLATIGFADQLAAVLARGG